MRAVLQCVTNSDVKVNNKIVGQINKGYMILVGFTNEDNEEIIDKMVNKIINLRVFTDSNDKMNLSIKDIEGSILSISQFTLYSKLNSRRPSFVDALNYNDANNLYNIFNNKLKEQGIKVETGIFGEDMKVNLTNDGPITIIIDSKYDL